MQRTGFIAANWLPGWSRIHTEKAVIYRHFVITASEDTPADTPADDWLSPNTSSCFWTLKI
jgi:hypothetical protein